MDTVERAIEDLFDRMLDDYDFTDIQSNIKDAVLQEVQSEFSDVEELERRVKDLEDKLERMARVLMEHE